jgi:hypothetical protein
MVRANWALPTLPLGGALVLAIAGLAAPAWAQRVVPKLQAICPLGYVDTFKGTCSTLGLASYTVAPTRGKACPSGWMNVGGGYCRRK